MTQPLCRYCGKPIRKSTRHNYVVRARQPHMTDNAFARYVVCDELPQTKAECQKLVNEQVVSVKRHYQVDKGIASFGTWDGESYVDKFFCNGDHARKFAYKCAAANKATIEYLAAKIEQDKASAA